MLIDGVKRWFRGRGRGDDGGDSGAGGGNGTGTPECGEPEMIPCEEALARLQEFVDGELTDLTQEQVEAHFEVCTRCYPHLALESSFKERVHAALARPAVPHGLRDRVLDLLRQEG